jgi:Rv2525c-like, glycoside hydrolase-like domain
VRRIALAATLCAAVVAILGPTAARTDTARLAVSRATFTGPGFDTCTAPSLDALGAWLASPYRAVGIYVGGANRACADGNLTASWVASATAGGWSLIPLYVGLQAPCVSDRTLARIDPASAPAQGTAAATDAVARAQLFGLGPGIPLYFDMEGYSTTDPACTQAVQQFVSAWVDELHALGYVAGIYGSASSTIRDMVPLASSGSSPPDQVDIGNWNGNPGVFGDPYVSDAFWAHHQRIHQYRGGHNETYGGVTLNVDDDYLDGAVAAATASAPVGGPTPAGSATSADGLVAVGWPAGSFPQVADVTVTPTALRRRQNGFAAGSYAVQLAVTAAGGGAPMATFAAPVSLRFLQPAAAGLVPAESADGQTWTVLLRLPRARLPAGATAGYTVGGDGRVTVLTTAPGWFGLLRDVGRPTRPETPAGRFSGGALRLTWPPSQDNSGSIARYQILRGGTPVASVAGGSTSAAVRSLDPGGRSVFRVVAVDAAGNPSIPSGALLVVRRSRPADAPPAIPAWAWQLLEWQRRGRSASRPATPRPLPGWYWHWASWELQPYRITPNG